MKLLLIILNILVLFHNDNGFRLLADRVKRHFYLHSSLDDDTLKNFNYENFSFELLKTDTTGKTEARTARLKTPHGIIETPAFVFCATKAAMKAVTPDMLRAENTSIMLSNTYHLMLTPGSELIESMGGLQKFTGWNGPMLTDSGGYQIFSMGHGSVSSEIKGKRDTVAMGWNQTLIKIDENGATFRSYIDGSVFHLTPESSVKIQRELGADLIVVLDECTPFNVDKEYTAASMRRSHRWAIRSLKEFMTHTTHQQALYGIIQGGVYEDLREESVNFINTYSFFGTAIGGSLGATKKSMHDIVAYTRKRIRNDRPIHLLGIGGIRDIFHGVRCGIDTFDCVHPTRLARHGGALVMAAHWDEPPHPIPPMTIMTASKEKARLSSQPKNPNNKTNPTSNNNSENKPPAKTPKQIVREHINVSKSKMRNDPRPIDATCGCYTCSKFSRAYLHHLFKAKESLGGMLVTIHNIHFMNRLMREIRHGINEDKLDDIEAMFVHPDLVSSLATGVNNDGDDDNTDHRVIESIGA